MLEQLHGRFSEEVEAFIGSSQAPLAHLQLLRSRLFGLTEQPEFSSALEVLTNKLLNQELTCNLRCHKIPV